MSPAGIFQLVALLVALAVTVPPLGRYLAAVFGDPDHHGAPAPTPGDRIFAPVERAIHRLCGIDPASEQRWGVYARSLLAFSLVSVLALYALLRLQGGLPMNPTEVGAVDAPVAWNTAVSFVTNTNWQAYSGEVTMSHLSQMAGLTVQNVVSAAAGMAVIAAVIRGITRRRSTTLGNFWVDMIRICLRVLLPLSLRGVASGSLLVFISAIGYYITPALIGGPGDQMISSIIAFYATGSANWGMAGALGVVLLVATLLLYSVYARLSSDEPGRR